MYGDLAILPNRRWSAVADSTGSGATQNLLTFLGGVIAAVVGLFGIRLTARSQEKQKKTDVEIASAGHFIALGESLIDERSEEAKSLRDEVKAHTAQILSLYKEIYEYKGQCEQLTRKVEMQTAQIEEQARVIETLRLDNTKLREINRELMANVRNNQQISIAASELLADLETDKGDLR